MAAAAAGARRPAEALDSSNFPGVTEYFFSPCDGREAARAAHVGINADLVDNNDMRKRRWRRLFRAALIGCGVFVVLIVAGYTYVTRPAFLRAKLAHALSRADLKSDGPRFIQFSPGGSISFSELTAVRTGDSTRLTLQVGEGRVDLDFWALLEGDAEPTDVKLFDAQLIVEPIAARPAGDGAAERAAPSPPPPAAGAPPPQRRKFPPPARLPRIAVDRLDVRVMTDRGGRPSLARRWVLTATGDVQTDEQGGPRYVMRVAQLAGAADGPLPGGDPTLASVTWDGARLAGHTGWVDLALLRDLAPRSLAQQMAESAAHGQVALEELSLDESGLHSATIRVAEFGFAAPIEESDEPIRPEARYAQIRDATGSIAFRRDGPARGALSADMRGLLNGSPMSLAVTVQNLPPDPFNPPPDAPPVRYRAKFRADSLTVPTESRHPLLFTSPHVPNGIRMFLVNYQPRGQIRIDVDVDRDGSIPSGEERGGRRRIEVVGVFEPLDAWIRYYRFPYDVRVQRGVVRYARDNVQLDGVVGRRGSAVIRADGWIYGTRPWGALDLAFRAYNVPMDTELYEALPERYHAMWDGVAPAGLCDAYVTVQRERSTPEAGSNPVKIDVDLALPAASLDLTRQYHVSQTDARIRIGGGEVRLDGLCGRMGEAELRVWGLLAPGDGAAREDVRVEAFDYPIDETRRLRDEGGDLFGTIRLQLAGDAWGRVPSTSESGAGGSFAVRVRDGLFTAFDPGSPWTDLSGWIARPQDGAVRLELAGRHGEGRMKLDAVMPRQGGMLPTALRVEASDADADTLVRQVLPERWAAIRDDLNLSGPGTLDLRYLPPSSDPSGRWAFDAVLRAAGMNARPVPLPLRDVELDVSVRRDSLLVRRLFGRYGDGGSLTLRGESQWSAEPPWIETSVETTPLPLSDELIAAMPAPLRELLERIEARGRMRTVIERLRITGHGAARQYDLAGAADLTAGSLRLGLPLTEFDGSLRGTCTVLPGGDAALSADFTIAKGKLGDWPLERVEGRLRRERGDRWFRIEGLRGRLCDGEVIGIAAVEPTRGEYEFSLTVQDVSLGQFLRPGRAAEQSGGQDGRVAGSIFLRGVGRGPQGREGGGNIEIRRGSLLNTPVSAKVLEASRAARQKTGDLVERALLQFAWEGDVLRFNRVEIDTRDLRFVGTGQWNIRSDAVDLTLVTVPPVPLPDLGPLTDFGRELVQYRVTGTSKNPTVELEVLRTLTEPLRRLIEGR